MSSSNGPLLLHELKDSVICLEKMNDRAGGHHLVLSQNRGTLVRCRLLNIRECGINSIFFILCIISIFAYQWNTNFNVLFIVKQGKKLRNCCQQLDDNYLPVCVGSKTPTFVYHKQFYVPISRLLIFQPYFTTVAGRRSI